MAIEIGALNITTISQARTEKIPVSGVGDPCVTIETIGRAISGGTVVKVEYGSSSDQAATIAAAVTAATAGDTLIFGMGVLKIETQITIDKRLNIVCLGTMVTTSSNISVFRFAAGSDGSTFQGGYFTGSGEDSGSTTQTAINTTASKGVKIFNVHAESFGGNAFIVGNAGATSYETEQWVQVSAKNCNLGFEITGVYIAITASLAVSCNNGWHLTGCSNVELSNCDGNGNEGYGLRLTGAGKGKVMGGNFNHNVGNGLEIISLTSDGVQRFVGTSIVANTSGIDVKNSNATVVTIDFVGCHIDSGMVFDATTALRVIFTGNIFNGSSADSGTVTNVIYVNNYTEDGTLYAG